jgi:hypothetical protein
MPCSMLDVMRRQWRPATTALIAFRVRRGAGPGQAAALPIMQPSPALRADIIARARRRPTGRRASQQAAGAAQSMMARQYR